MSYYKLRKINYEHNDNKGNLQWYVFLFDINTQTMVLFNIFNHWKFCQDVNTLLDKDLSFEELVEGLERELRFYFGSKTEYEIVIGESGVMQMPSIFDKIDIYDQVLPNIQILANYIMDYWV